MNKQAVALTGLVLAVLVVAVWLWHHENNPTPKAQAPAAASHATKPTDNRGVSALALAAQRRTATQFGHAFAANTTQNAWLRALRQLTTPELYAGFRYTAAHERWHETLTAIRPTPTPNVLELHYTHHHAARITLIETTYGWRISNITPVDVR